MLLTEQERERFLLYLNQNIESSKGIMEPMKALGPIGKTLIQKEQIKLAAFAIVATHLESTESTTI